MISNDLMISNEFFIVLIAKNNFLYYNQKMNAIQPSNSNQDVPNFNTTEIGKSLENVASNIGQSLVKSKDVVFNSINDFGNATIPSIKEA
jgi:hypothetical protein